MTTLYFLQYRIADLADEERSDDLVPWHTDGVFFNYPAALSQLEHVKQRRSDHFRWRLIKRTEEVLSVSDGNNSLARSTAELELPQV